MQTNQDNENYIFAAASSLYIASPRLTSAELTLWKTSLCGLRAVPWIISRKMRSIGSEPVTGSAAPCIIITETLVTYTR